MKTRLKTEMKEAMKAKDKVRLNTIRSILSAIQYEEMQKGTEELSEDAILAILKAESKKRKESLQFASDAGRDEEVAELNTEIDVIDSFLPQQLSEAELEKIIAELQSEQPDIVLGAVMKELKSKYNGKYDGKLASQLAKKLLG